MNRFLEIDNGLWIVPKKVMAVKAGFKGQCAVFMNGQSALDQPFLVKRDAEEVVEEIESFLEDDDEGDETDEGLQAG